jgi:hypothetical protein
LPPPDCPHDGSTSRGLLFQNAYSAELKDFRIGKAENKVLIEPPALQPNGRTNGPLTILPDHRASPPIKYFTLKSLRFACEYYVNLWEFETGKGQDSEDVCTAKMICEIGDPARTRLTAFWTYRRHLQGLTWSMKNHDPWTFNSDVWKELTKCELTVDKGVPAYDGDPRFEKDGVWFYVIMLDDLEVDVQTC